MDVLRRQYMSLVVIQQSLPEFVKQLCAAMPDTFKPVEVPLVFPAQPYHTEPNDPPMLLWTPTNAPHLTAFMPSVMSGDYFVGYRASTDLALRVITLRTTPQDVQWPINEFIAYRNGTRQRAVRAMLDGSRWEFWQAGDPMPFESAYNARRKRDRLDRERVFAYAVAWGAPINESAFWVTQDPALTLVRQ